MYELLLLTLRNTFFLQGIGRSIWINIPGQLLGYGGVVLDTKTLPYFDTPYQGLYVGLLEKEQK